MATLEQLKEGIVRAHQAGNLEHARILADAYKAQAAQETKQPEELPDRTLEQIGGDVMTTAAKGIAGALQAGVGLADIPTGGYAGKALKPYLDLEKLQQGYSEHYSPQTQAALKATEEAQGFGNTLAAYAQNPSAIAANVGESIPSMIAGGALGKGLQGLKLLGSSVVGGAVGEGLMGAGSAAENLRERSADELLSGRDIGAAVGSGIGTAALGLVGGKLAERFGVADPDTLLAGGLKALKAPSANKAEALTKDKFLKQMVGAGISEGVFEEMPQSAQEQMWANFANDKPIAEGVPEAMASGLITGGVMGGVGGGYTQYQLPQTTTPPPPPPEQETPPETTGGVNIMTPTVEALTPEAKRYMEELAQKEKSATVKDWLGSEHESGLYKKLMAQDFKIGRAHV